MTNLKNKIKNATLISAITASSLFPNHIEAREAEFLDTPSSENIKAKTPSYDKKTRPFDAHRIETENGNINYWFDSETLCYDGYISIRTEKLLPQIYANKDGTYKCGPLKGRNKRILRERTLSNLQILAVHECISQDIKKRESNGETLKQEEINFIKVHAQRMERYGLFVNKQGKIQQKNPDMTLNILSSKQR